MGLSSKQVVGDGLDWGQNLMQAGTLELPKTLPMKRQHQQLQQQSEPLNCPRCGSTNTKFCYYNNYNKSQPRHFCKSCKRHWTKGGNLRNVPVGGGRKNKRPKTSNAAATSVAAKSGGTSTITTTATQMGIQNQNHQCQSNCNPPLLPLVDDQKSLSDILSQALNQPQFLLQHDPINSTTNFNYKDLGKNDGVFVGSTLPLSLPLQFPFSSSDNPSSNSGCFQSSNAYNYIGGSEAMEESTITAIPQPWQVPPTTTTTSSVMDMPSYWADTWENFNTFLSTDLNIPWDDSEIKPSI